MPDMTDPQVPWDTFPANDPVLPHNVACDYIQSISAPANAASPASADAEDAPDDDTKPSPLLKILQAFALPGEKRSQMLGFVDRNMDAGSVQLSDTSTETLEWQLTEAQLAGMAPFKHEQVVPLSKFHTPEEVKKIVEDVTSVRALLPKLPQSKTTASGYLMLVNYDVRGTNGWMYISPPGKYLDWLEKQIDDKIAACKQAYEDTCADPELTVEDRKRAWFRWGQACTVKAIRMQEGDPAALNTYDGLVLSWGIGIAGPGLLPETFQWIRADANVDKVFRLCGWTVDADLVDKNYHGRYQVLDLSDRNNPVVRYRDNFVHAVKDGQVNKREYCGDAFKVLSHVTKQIELLYMLVQLARDPLTRVTIFKPNLSMIERFAAVAMAEKMKTLALYVFTGQVKHCWGLGVDFVLKAAASFNDDEKALSIGTEDFDRALVAAIARYLAAVFQRQKWRRAVAKLRVDAKKAKKAGTPLAAIDLHTTLPDTEYGFSNSFEKRYLKFLNAGTWTSGAGLSVSKPWTVAKSAADVPSDHYCVVEQWRITRGDTAYLDFGPQARIPWLIFAREDKVKLLGFDADDPKRIVIEEDGKRRVVNEKGEPA
jgi:hypothetical protein